MIKTIIAAMIFLIIFIVYLFLSISGVDVISEIIKRISFLGEGLNILIVFGFAAIIAVSFILFRASSSK